MTRVWLLAACGVTLAIACAPATKSPENQAASAPEAALSKIVPPSRVAFEREIDGACELVVPFYEGLHFSTAGAALRSVKSEYLELAYPGALSMPLVAWRCGEGKWTAVTTTTPESTPASLIVRTKENALNVRLECFGPCTFREIESEGSWQAMAEKVARAMNLHTKNPPLASRYDAMHFFVRTWVSADADPPLRTDWTRDALAARMKTESSKTMSFVFGLDPNEVDLEGHYFWNDGAHDEIQGIFRANPNAAQFHWLNLRTYKTAIARLGITRSIPPEMAEAAKMTAHGVAQVEQYMFKATEMCLGAQPWQDSRIAEMKKLLDLGFRVIAFDEFPTAYSWSAEPCRAKNHLHRANDFADEQRVALDLVRKLAEMAHARGALLASEEPSLELLPFTSGYMDGAFDDPSDMYEHWQKGAGIETIPFFSTMFGRELTPYTRPAKAHHAPPGWIVQEQISGSR